MTDFKAQVDSKISHFDKEDEEKKEAGEKEREQRGFFETISYLQHNRYLFVTLFYFFSFIFAIFQFFYLFLFADN